MSKEFKVGQKWLTIDGTIEVIIGIGGDGRYPIIGSSSNTYTIEGHMYRNILSGHDLDALLEDAQPVVKVNPNRHKYADLIHAYAEGAKIQYLDLDVGLEDWVDIKEPRFDGSGEYRIKPVETPKPVYPKITLSGQELCELYNSNDMLLSVYDRYVRYVRIANGAIESFIISGAAHEYVRNNPK